MPSEYWGRMMKGSGLNEFVIKESKALGIEYVQSHFSSQKKYEFSLEAGEIALLRTTDSNRVNVQSIIEQRQARISTNRLSLENIKQSCRDLKKQALSSPRDPHYKIADPQKKQVIEFNLGEPEYDELYSQLESFRDYVKERHPKILMEQAALTYTATQTDIQNTNDVHHEIQQNYIEFWSIFTAKDGEKTSSFNHSSILLNQLPDALVETGTTKRLLQESEEQLDQKPFQGKFEGDLVIAPDALGDFISFLLRPIADYEMLEGSSVLKDKINKEVVHQDFHLRCSPQNSDLIPVFVNSDGYITQEETIFENGKLRNYLLSDYAANKLGISRSLSGGGNCIVASGNKRFDKLVESVSKGVLLNRFSGGSPSKAGDFSGVAKNSYYIEKGEVQYPIKELMISGNIFKLFNNIQGISRERINFGTSFLPWIRFSGVTCSGK
jgi:PmbA protein